MEQYIPKSDLIVEIEGLKERYALCPTRNNYEEGLKEGRLIGYIDALDKINSIEVKKVDLEKEINAYMDNELKFLSDEVGYDTFSTIVKHFFELGIKAKEENEKKYIGYVGETSTTTTK